MSRELVVLTRERPDLAVLPDLVGGRGLSVGGAYVFDAGDRLLVRVREPILVMVPGEVERLLDTDVEAPVWWTDVRAAADLAEARMVARHCAEQLASRHDGTVWSESSS
ncbi:hypothetical protein [Actinomadura xylanilytica]|uniref:hypothetical protein n=1 Tax=Actinomadura xylanilytica TaxID=887459 RepID=UPI00255B0385|nr:hypothetical protein [Actinomadura xylanilytica]MDL4772592.1 hypothetical protein [Actinomadura xylanilytica]